MLFSMIHVNSFKTVSAMLKLGLDSLQHEIRRSQAVGLEPGLQLSGSTSLGLERAQACNPDPDSKPRSGVTSKAAACRAWRAIQGPWMP